MSRTTEEPKERTLGIRLSERDHAALTMQASSMDRSRGDVVRALIRQAAAFLERSPGASSPGRPLQRKDRSTAARDASG